jgi:ABC-2 type transport system ATP-binding protein
MIEIKNLSKSYGAIQALNQVNISIDDGDIFGYIGPNGAGKSTTFKILATLLIPDSGHAVIDGFSVASQAGKVRQRIGYMPDVFGAYEDMTITEYLTFFAALYDVPPGQRKSVIEGVLDLTDLRSKKAADCHSLSRGMQQRLGLARVLLHDPKVLLLDEPASGLDPRARIEIRELLRELKNMGKTILISSHILSELAEISTKIGVIEQGQLLFSGSTEELVKKVQHQSIVTIKVKDRLAEALVATRKLDFIERASLAGQAIEISFKRGARDASDLVHILTEKNFRILSIQENELNLESCFMLLTKGHVA